MRAIFLVFAAVACCANAKDEHPASDGTGNNVPVLTQSEQCTEAFVTGGAPQWPKAALRAQISGWVIVQYDLDGTGKAKNVAISQSSPQQVFDQASLDSIRRTKFAPNFTKTGCRTLISFSLK